MDSGSVNLEDRSSPDNDGVIGHGGDIEIEGSWGWYGLTSIGGKIVQWHYGVRVYSELSDGSCVLEVVTPVCVEHHIVAVRWHGPFAEPQMDDLKGGKLCASCAMEAELP